MSRWRAVPGLELALGATLAATGTSAIATAGTTGWPSAVAAMGGVAVGAMVALRTRALRTLALRLIALRALALLWTLTLGTLALRKLALGTRGGAAIAALFANFRRRPQCPGRAHRFGKIAGQRFDVELLAS